MRAAKRLGLRVGLVEAANDGFKSTSRELLRTPVPDTWGRHGNFGVNLCPINPKAHEVLMRDWSRLLDEFADVGLGLRKILAVRRRGLRLQRVLAVGSETIPEALPRTIGRAV